MIATLATVLGMLLTVVFCLLLALTGPLLALHDRLPLQRVKRPVRAHFPEPARALTALPDADTINALGTDLSVPELVAAGYDRGGHHPRTTT